MTECLLARLRGCLLPLAREAELPPHARPAAVLVLLRETPLGVQVLLTRRTGHLARHAGQIACPGGARDLADTTFCETALREADEEMGLPKATALVVGRLSTVYVRASGFAIVPIVAIARAPFTPRPNAGEVAEWFWQPLSDLRRVRELERPPDREPRPVFPLPSRRVWGATARLLGDLLDRLDSEGGQRHHRSS